MVSVASQFVISRPNLAITFRQFFRSNSRPQNFDTLLQLILLILCKFNRNLHLLQISSLARCFINCNSKNSHFFFFFLNFFITVRILHARHIHARFERRVSHFSHYTPPSSHDHKSGNVAAVVFNGCFFTKAGTGALLRLSPRENCPTLHLLRLGPALRCCAIRIFLKRGATVT